MTGWLLWGLLQTGFGAFHDVSAKIFVVHLFQGGFFAHGRADGSVGEVQTRTTVGAVEPVGHDVPPDGIFAPAGGAVAFAFEDLTFFGGVVFGIAVGMKDKFHGKFLEKMRANSAFAKCAGFGPKGLAEFASLDGIGGDETKTEAKSVKHFFLLVLGYPSSKTRRKEWV